MSIDSINGGNVGNVDAYDPVGESLSEPATSGASSSPDPFMTDGVEPAGNYAAVPEYGSSSPPASPPPNGHFWVPILGDDGSVSYPSQSSGGSSAGGPGGGGGFPILGDDGEVTYPNPSTDPPVIGTNGIPILDDPEEDDLSLDGSGR